jgi:hypothetical protein
MSCYPQLTANKAAWPVPQIPASPKQRIDTKTGWGWGLFHKNHNSGGAGRDFHGKIRVTVAWNKNLNS